MELSTADIENALRGKELPKRRFRPLYFLALLLTAAAVVTIVVAYLGVVAALLYGVVKYSVVWAETLSEVGAPNEEFGAHPMSWILLGIILFLPVSLI